ncbi:MAG TPA: ATP-dependent zinc metalloprotease FtsH [Chloroflexia bacterium]|nr:ATP-dependent zinc metalloprotease FtsH [Chloroflexia bacterium]
MSKKTLAIGTILIVVFLGLFFLTGKTQGEKLAFSDVLTKARNGEIKTIVTNPNNHNITIIMNNAPDKEYTSTYPAGKQKFDDILANANIPDDKYPDVTSDSTALSDRWRTLFLLLAALVGAGLFVIWYRNRSAQNRESGAEGGGPFAMGRSKARLITPQKVGVTFADVAGADEAKQELQEVVEFLKHSEKFAALGARIPKGVLLVGPPGTGKTLLAKAIAGEANVPFMSVSGSEFVEMYVGVGASRVRNLFTRAKKMAPCIIFIDEIDALGRKRGARTGGGTEEREQTLNQLLVEMDGFDSNTNIIIVAATNRPDVLDSALLRPGRFDRQVTIDNPDYVGRNAILQVHARNKPFEPEVNLDRIAKQTPGFSGADLMNLVNEAAILTARRNKKAIGLLELEEAIDRVIAGPERRSRIISEREKVTTAYHEVGHALVAKLVGTVDPVQKVSIVARGRMGGYTRVGAGADRTLWTKTQLEDFMAFALGGAAAEELTFGEVTTGPSNDIERVSDIARTMVCDYGMSEKFGPLALGSKDGGGFVGGGSRQSNYSDTVAYQIDQEVHALVQKALSRAKNILTRYNLHLIAISNYVLEKEVISGDEMDEIFEQVEREGMGVNMFALRPFTNDQLGIRGVPGKLGESSEEGSKAAAELPGGGLTDAGEKSATGSNVAASSLSTEDPNENHGLNRTAV